MALGITRKLITTCFSLILVAGFSTAIFANNKEVITGDIRENKASTTVIAKAPTDLGFKALDMDADGKVSLKEAIKDRALAENFNATDVNHDGAITVDEYALYSSTSKKETAVNL